MVLFVQLFSETIKVVFKVSYISRGVLPFKLALLCWLFWPTMTKNNKGNLFVFEVGPSVKFVSAIEDAIFKKKIGVNFLFGKNAKPGKGGPRGVWQKTTLFPDFFSEPFPNNNTSLSQKI